MIDETPKAQPETAKIDVAAVLRRSRGAQLRALILSWATNETYQRVLQIQAEDLQDKELEISDDWGEVADSILEQFSVKANLIMPEDL